MPIVSVMMPAYNADRYVAEAIESVLAQTLTDFEFIIIDDGSTDGTRAVVEGYAGRDGRIRFASRPNRGIGATRNEAMAMATADLVAVMDADDVALPGRLEAQVGYLRAHPECVAVGGWAETIDSDGAPIGRWQLPCDHEAIDAANLAGQQAVIHPTLTARREAVLAAGAYNADLSEDLDLLLRLAERGRLANLPEVLLRCRRHSASTIHMQSEPLVESTAVAVVEARRRRGLEPVSMPKSRLSLQKHISDHHRNWAWQALGHGHLATARKHAMACLRHRPLSPSSWKLVLCVLRGY